MLGMGEAHVAEGGTAVEKLAYPDAVGATVSECQNISPFPDKQVFRCPISECQQWCVRIPAIVTADSGRS
jgi:hypothetical protein